MNWTLEDASKLDAIWRQVTKKLTVEQSESTPVRIEVLDDFDNHILKSRSMLVYQDGRYHLSTPQADFELETGKSFQFAHDLPEGDFRQALTDLINVRKVTTVASGQLQHALITLRDDEKKAVLGITTYLRGERAYIQLSPLRGYKKVAQRMRRILAVHDARLEDKPLAQLLLDTSGFTLSDYEAKPKFALDPQMPAREAVRMMISTMLEVVRINESGIIQHGDDTEFLHDYRVSLRKVRSLISLLKEVYPAEEQQALKQRLGDIARRTNELRDLDVYLLEKNDYAALVPGSLRTGLSVMFDDYTRQHKEAYRTVCRWLSSKSYKQEMAALRAFFSDADSLAMSRGSKTPIKKLVTGKIIKRYRKICRLGLQITPQTPNEQVHQLRIECKKFRYLLEFFGELYNPKLIKQLVKRLKQLQDNLGKFNDYSVQQASLRTYLAAHEPNNELALSIGALLLVLDQKQHQERSQVETRFAAFADDVTAGLVHDLFEK